MTLKVNLRIFIGTFGHAFYTTSIYLLIHSFIDEKKSMIQMIFKGTMKSSSSYSIEDLKGDPEADYSNQKLNNGQTGKDHASSNR